MSYAGTMQCSRTDRRKTTRAGALGLFAIGLALLGACGDDETKIVSPRRDAAADLDATTDGSITDGSFDAGKDSGPDDDDGGGSDMDGSNPCEMSGADNALEIAIPFSDESGFSLTTGTTGFGVAYHAKTDGCNEIRALPVRALGAFAPPEALLDDCKTIKELALLRVGDGWQMTWVDNANGSAELQSMQVSAGMTNHVGELRTRLTNNALREQGPVLADLGGTPFLAYITTDPATGKAGISGLRMDGTSALQELIPEAAGHRPVRLALSRIGKAQAVLAWIEEVGDSPGVWLQRIDLAGTKLGDAVRLSEFVSAGNSVDFAARDLGEGGAALYSVSIGGVNREVRFQRLSETGEYIGDEIKIVGQPLQASDASFARLGGGYAVVYRALPGGNITEPQIRLTFIGQEGNVMRDASGGLVSYAIAKAGAGGGRTTIRLSTDGQLLIGFVDGDGTSTKLRLIRQRLDCAL